MRVTYTLNASEIFDRMERLNKVFNKFKCFEIIEKSKKSGLAQPFICKAHIFELTKLRFGISSFSGVLLSSEVFFIFTGAYIIISSPIFLIELISENKMLIHTEDVVYELTCLNKVN